MKRKRRNAATQTHTNSTITKNSKIILIIAWKLSKPKGSNSSDPIGSKEGDNILVTEYGENSKLDGLENITIHPRWVPTLSSD